MAGPNPQQVKKAISVAEHLLEEAREALRVAKQAAYAAGGTWGFNQAVQALQNAGHRHVTHEGDHDTPRGHTRVH